MGTEGPVSTPDLTRRLVFCRDLLRLAENLHRSGTDLSRAESIVVLDAASEALLKIVIDYQSDKARSGPTRNLLFQELASRVSNLTESPSETRSVMDHLHRVRNVIQHEATLVAASEVDALHSEAASLLGKLSRKHLGVELLKVSLADLFVDQVVRELYRRAESAYAQGLPEEAAISLVAAFEKARFEEQQRLWGSMITWQKFAADLSSSEDEDIATLRDYVETLHEEVEALKLRIDYKQYRKFCEIAPTILSPHFGENLPFSHDVAALEEHWRTTLTGDSTAASIFRLALKRGEWLSFAFGFVANAVLMWQQESRRGVFDLFLPASEA